MIGLLLKSTLVLGFALCVVWFARRARASVRHAVLVAAFGVLAVLPLVLVFAPAVPVAVPVATRVQVVPPRVASAPEVEFAAVAQREFPQSAVVESSDLVVWSVWVVGLVCFLVPVIIGLWQIRSIRRTGLPWARAGVDGRVDVLLHESLAGPMTCGVARPAIVFPVDAREWAEEDLDRAFAHELEHVRRRDWVWHCVARVVCAVYWFHPLVWMAWRRLGLEAERACDDAVLRGSAAVDYADQLVGLAARMPVSALGMAGRSDLAVRVRAVLDSGQARGRVGWVVVAFACVAGVVSVTMSPLKVVAATQKFEVVSVRMEDPKDPHSSPEYTNTATFRVFQTAFPSNRLTMRHASLNTLIAEGLGVDGRRIQGPDWLGREHYDLDAKVEGDARLTREQMRPLLRAMLEDRFHLKAHHVKKIVPGYALTIAKGGARVTLNQGAPFIGIYGGYHLKWVNSTIADFVPQLEKPVHGPVVDKTGLKGMYDFDLTFGPHDAGEFDHIREELWAGLPDIFTVLQEKYGLKLVPQKVLIDTLVVDHVEKNPTAN